MTQDRLVAVDGLGASLIARRTNDEVMDIAGTYHVSCQRVKAGYETLAAFHAQELALLRQEGAEQSRIDEAEQIFIGLPREEAWNDVIHNVVTTVGKNLTLDTILGGAGYTAAVVMGLKGVGSAAASDTMTSHAAWSEVGGTNVPAYSGNRPSPAFAASAAGVKQTSAAVVYTFTSSGTVAGCFVTLAGSATKDNTTGTLLSAGDFSGGNKSVANTDVLNVTYSLAL
jgi:hypothetical protein